MVVVGSCLAGSVICLITHWLERPNFASWDKSGPTLPPLPSIVWQVTQPAETKRPLPSWLSPAGAVVFVWPAAGLAGLAAEAARLQLDWSARRQLRQVPVRS